MKLTAAEFRQQQAAPAPNKYGAKRVTIDGITFDSKREANRWLYLLRRRNAGEIRDLQRQVVIPLMGRDGPMLTRTGRQVRITVDFSYVEVETGLLIYEDSKGKPTRDYEVRRAAAAAQGVEVREV